MRRELTILFLSAGRRVELMECFRKDARDLGLSLRVLAADIKPDWSAACAKADRAFSVPKCTTDEFPGFLHDLCVRERVGLIIPTIDTELPVLSRLAPALETVGSHTVISSNAVVEMARDKLLTARMLGDAGISVPGTIPLEEFSELPPGWSWPLFAKPRAGSSSIGIRIVQAVDVPSLKEEANMILQERLTGSEYTVNMFFDRSGTLKAVVPHLRVETRSGEVSKAETCRIEDLEGIGWKLGEMLDHANGPICFQAMRRATGEFAIFEINARFGGGFPIAHKAGARFSRWLLEEHAGLPSTAHNNWRSGIRMLRYDSAVFQ